MPATALRILNIKTMQWLETEVMWICRNLLGKTREITWSELIFGEFFRCAAASITSVAGAGSSKRNDERGHPMRVYSVNDHSSLRGEAIYRQCVHLEWVKHDKRGNIIKGVSVLKLRVSCCCDSWNLEKKGIVFSSMNHNKNNKRYTYKLRHLQALKDGKSHARNFSTDLDWVIRELGDEFKTIFVTFHSL